MSPLEKLSLALLAVLVAMLISAAIPRRRDEEDDQP
jgi:hypothetical protein